MLYLVTIAKTERVVVEVEDAPDNDTLVQRAEAILNHSDDGRMGAALAAKYVYSVQKLTHDPH